jgi:hypothetical protein
MSLETRAVARKLHEGLGGYHAETNDTAHQGPGVQPRADLRLRIWGLRFGVWGGTHAFRAHIYVYMYTYVLIYIYIHTYMYIYREREREKERARERQRERERGKGEVSACNPVSICARIKL